VTKTFGRSGSVKPVLNLHIGLNKTGSTSLQSFLLHNSEQLRQKGVLYPGNRRLMLQAGHHRLAASIVGTDWQDLLDLSGGGDDPAEMLSLVRQEVDKAGCGQVVISSELLSSGQADRVAEVFGGLFSDTRIILYIRNYPDFMESFLAQEILAEGLDSETFGKEYSRNFSLGLRGHYRRVLDAYSSAFGRENIRLRILEKEQLTGGGICSDFLGLIGIEEVSGFRDAGIRNVTPGRNGLEFMMLLNRIHKNEGIDFTWVRILRRQLKRVAAKRRYSLLESGLREEIPQWCEEECRGIARDFLGREDGRLFLSPGGKELEGNEHYPGLDPEFALRVALATAEKAISQGAFPDVVRRADAGGEAAQPSSLAGRWARRIPGMVRMRQVLRRLIG